jgi:hypothetical protein
MKLKELKEYINSLPDRLNEFNVVNGELIVVKDEQSLALINHTVMTVYVDEPNKEIQFLHQSEDDVKDLLTDKGDGNS